MDINSEDRLKEVCPALATLIREQCEELLAEIPSIEIRVTQGLRSWQMQQEIWQEGRDEMGTVIDPKKVVSNAPPGYSWHEFGLAVDVCPFVDGKPDWDIKHPSWTRIPIIGTSVGLVSGYCFHDPDRPHLQLTGHFGLSPDDTVRATFREAGLIGVWKGAGLA